MVNGLHWLLQGEACVHGEGETEACRGLCTDSMAEDPGILPTITPSLHPVLGTKPRSSGTQVLCANH